MKHPHEILIYALVNIKNKTMENHHAIHGNIHELSMAIFNSKLLVYQRI